MNRTKNLLIGLVTVVAMPAFADTKTTTSSSDENCLEALFKADLQYRSESEIRRCRGCRRTRRCLHRKWRWNGDRRSASRSGSLVAMVWECPYPLIRSGQSVPGGLQPLHYQSRGVHRNPGRSSNPIRWQRLWPSQLRKVPNEPHTNLQHRGCPL